MMKIELKVFDIDIKISHMTVHVILQWQSWRDDIHQVFAYNYSEDKKILK